MFYRTVNKSDISFSSERIQLAIDRMSYIVNKSSWVLFVGVLSLCTIIGVFVFNVIHQKLLVKTLQAYLKKTTSASSSDFQEKWKNAFFSTIEAEYEKRLWQRSQTEKEKLIDKLTKILVDGQRESSQPKSGGLSSSPYENRFNFTIIIATNNLVRRLEAGVREINKRCKEDKENMIKNNLSSSSFSKDREFTSLVNEEGKKFIHEYYSSNQDNEEKTLQLLKVALMEYDDSINEIHLDEIIRKSDMIKGLLRVVDYRNNSHDTEI